MSTLPRKPIVRLHKLMVRRAANDFEALLIGMSAYEVGCRVVSVCSSEQRDWVTAKPLRSALLVWIECPNEEAIGAVDHAIAGKRGERVKP